MDKLNLQQIVDSLDIKEGHPLMVSADITRLWAEYRKEMGKFEPKELIELLMKKVTEEGTLIFPTYSWDFCHGEGFDYNKTASRTGGLSRIALNMKEFRRTQHPIYSFAVWGKDAEHLCAMTNKSAFGKDSPFTYFNEKKVDYLTIGLKYSECYTFAHYVEQTVGVSYRYDKEFSGCYVDETGNKFMRTYSMYVRDLDMETENSEAIEELLQGVIRQKKEYYGVEFRIINFADSFPVLADDIINNRSRNIAIFKGQ